MEDNELDERMRLEMRKRKQTSPRNMQDSVLRTHQHNLCTLNGQSNINNTVDLSGPQHKMKKAKISQNEFNEPHDYSNQQWTSNAEHYSHQEHRKQGTVDSSTDTSDDEEKQNRLVIQHDIAPIKASRILLNKPYCPQRAQQNEASVSVLRLREKLLDEIFSMRDISVSGTSHIEDSTIVELPTLSHSRNTPPNSQHFRKSSREILHSNNVKSTGEKHSDQIVPIKTVINNNQIVRQDSSNETSQPSQTSNPSRHIPDFNIKVQFNLPIPEIVITQNTDKECIDQMGLPINTIKNRPPPSVQNTANVLNQQRQSGRRQPLLTQPRRAITTRKEVYDLNHNNHSNARNMPSITQHPIIDLNSGSSTPLTNNNISTESSSHRHRDQHTQTSFAEESPAPRFIQRPHVQGSLQNLSLPKRNIQSQTESVDLSVKSSTVLPHNVAGNRRNIISEPTQMNADTKCLPTACFGQISDRPGSQPMTHVYSSMHKEPHPQAYHTCRLKDISCSNEKTLGIQSGNQPSHNSESCNVVQGAPINENICERPTDNRCCCSCQSSREKQFSSHLNNHANQYKYFENSAIRRPTDFNYITHSFPFETNSRRASANIHSLHEDIVRGPSSAETSSRATRCEENVHLPREQHTSTTDINSASANYRFPTASEIIKMYNRSYNATSTEEPNNINRNPHTIRNIIKTNDKHSEEIKKNNQDDHHASNRHNAYIKYNPYILLPAEYNPNNTRWTLKYQNAESGLVELLPSSNIFVDEIRLRYYKLKAKNYNKLARMLLTEIFTPDALNVCSLIDPVKVLKMEVAREKACLDIHAIIVLLKFLQNYGHTKHWGVFDRQYTLESLRYKLKELKRKFTY